MAMEIQEQIKRSIRDANNLYQKLVLLVGKSGSGKTKILQKISEDFAAPMINVNLEVSYRLLDLPVDKRASTCQDCFLKSSKIPKVILYYWIISKFFLINLFSKTL